jgi:hypothetical protein
VNILSIHKDEGFSRVETKGNNVFDILVCHFLHLFQCIFRLEHEFLVISNLHHQRYIKNFLQPLSENHGDGVAKVQLFRGRSSASIKIKRPLLFIQVQYYVQVSVAKENPSSEESVRRFSC